MGGVTDRAIIRVSDVQLYLITVNFRKADGGDEHVTFANYIN